MAKAVLVMDMPHDCPMCKFFDLDERCHAVDVENPWSTDPEKAKPDWCPLRELPEKMEVCGTYNSEYFAKGGKMPSYKTGWNACLDEILKEPQNEGGAHGKEQSE